jgi:phosphate transport system ATP-binding protein
MESEVLKIEKFGAYFGDTQILKYINLSIPENMVTAIMGPSGCGKTTLIRCVNRMHELITGARVEGRILLCGEDVYKTNPILVRRKVGMVFQKPNPFPTMSIYDNVIAGYKLNGIRLGRGDLDRIVEESLQRAALWDEVKDSVHRKGTLLDPKATSRIEELIIELKEYVTIVLVTHNIAQAARVSDLTAFLYLGELVEFGPSEKLFTVPEDKRTEEYLTGKFG